MDPVKLDAAPPSPIRLDTLRRDRDRPTIPYAQFRPLPHVQPPSPVSATSRSFDLDELTLTLDTDSRMEGPKTVSGHRRRRSTLTIAIDEAHKHRRHGSPAIAEEVKGYDDDSPWSGEESKSGSDEHDTNEPSDEDEFDDDEETGLTAADKKIRSQRRRKNTLLDQRIVGQNTITEEEKKEADHNVLKDLLVNGALIGLWYLFSLSISIYNKWMFSPDHLDFHFPLFTTCMHMLVQFSLASLVLYLFPHYRPRHDSISNPGNAQTPETLRQNLENKKPLMTKWFYATRLGPCGMATGLDIGLGNMSLKFITLTFYTMCKSSALAFVLLFAFLFRLETPSARLVLIICTMTIGVIMMVAGEVDFRPLGFVLVISAAFFSGFRWGLTQILLLHNPATSNPFSSIFYLAPIMFLSLLILAVPVEGPRELLAGLTALFASQGSVWGPFILLFPGVVAFLMTSSEFALLQRTSVVTLSIAGIFKEVVTISAAGLVFHDPLTPINVSGLFVTIGAIAAYNYIKITKMRVEAREEVQRHGSISAGDAGVGANGYSKVKTDEADDAHLNPFTSDGDMMPLRSPALGKTTNPMEERR